MLAHVIGRTVLGIGVFATGGSMFAAPGDLDTSFGNDGVASLHVGAAFAGERAERVGVQRDGKVLLGGTINGSVTLLRLNADGTLDGSFGFGGTTYTNFNFGTVTALAIQPDGRILLGGSVYNSSIDSSQFAVWRYNTDGSADRSFVGAGGAIVSSGPDDYANDLALQPDGKIVLGGYRITGTQDYLLVRCHSNGSVDSSFGGGSVVAHLGNGTYRCSSVALAPDGKIVAGGYLVNSGGWGWALARFNANGSLDPTFSLSNYIALAPGPGVVVAGPIPVVVQADGKILMTGSIDSKFGVLRFNVDGSLDSSFGNGGRVLTHAGRTASSATRLALQRDGKIVVLGGYGDRTRADVALVRYLQDGTLDPSFGTNGVATIVAGARRSYGLDLEIEANGRIVVCGAIENDMYSDVAAFRFHGDTAPAITSHPESLTVNEGENAVFTVSASGTTPLSYRWRFNEANIPGQTGPTLSLTNVRVSNAGNYSVVVSNYLGVAVSSNAVLNVIPGNEPPTDCAIEIVYEEAVVRFPGATVPCLISRSAADACVGLAAAAHDPDNDALEFVWTVNGGLIGRGAIIMACFGGGSHLVTSTVSDGRGACTARVELCVMSAAEAVEQCVALVEQSAIERMRKRPLIATLSAAAASFEGGKIEAAFGQLKAFEHKVRAQVARNHPEIADLLLETVDDVRAAILWQMDLRLDI